MDSRRQIPVQRERHLLYVTLTLAQMLALCLQAQIRTIRTVLALPNYLPPSGSKRMLTQLPRKRNLQQQAHVVAGSLPTQLHKVRRFRPTLKTQRTSCLAAHVESNAACNMAYSLPRSIKILASIRPSNAGMKHRLHQSMLPAAPNHYSDLKNHPYRLEFKNAAQIISKQHASSRPTRLSSSRSFATSISNITGFDRRSRQAASRCAGSRLTRCPPMA